MRRKQPTLSCGQAAVAAPEGDSSKEGFSLMTYNMLADMLCTVEQFPGVDVQVLDSEHRGNRVTHSLTHLLTYLRTYIRTY